MLAGKCGFGRDSSIAIDRRTHAVFISFLDYNGDGNAKIASLAVLRPQTFEQQVKIATNTISPAASPSGKNDICKGVVFEE